MVSILKLPEKRLFKGKLKFDTSKEGLKNLESTQ